MLLRGLLSGLLLLPLLVLMVSFGLLFRLGNSRLLGRHFPLVTLHGDMLNSAQLG